MAKAERLTEADLDEILSVLNESFRNKERDYENQYEEDFEKNLPIMWTGLHNYGQKHFAVKEDGKIVSVLGVYPIPSMIGGHPILVGTVGNVGSLPAARGKGYMKDIMDAAFEEVDRLNLDIARLGGLRSRYNRYGFDVCTQLYKFTVSPRNLHDNPPPFKCSFEEIKEIDPEIIAFCRSCNERFGIYHPRETDIDFFASMRMWQCVPFLARDEKGEPIGYVCATPNRREIMEHGTREGIMPADMIMQFPDFAGVPSVVFQIQPPEKEDLRDAMTKCEEWHICSPTMMNVRNWDKVLYAVCDLKCQRYGMADGTAKVGINGYGTVEISVENNRVQVRRTEDRPEVILDHLPAHRFFFGPAEPEMIAELPANSILKSWLPLPLSWNEQDRV